MTTPQHPDQTSKIGACGARYDDVPDGIACTYPAGHALIQDDGDLWDHSHEGRRSWNVAEWTKPEDRANGVGTHDPVDRGDPVTSRASTSELIREAQNFLDGVVLHPYMPEVAAVPGVTDLYVMVETLVKIIGRLVTVAGDHDSALAAVEKPATPPTAGCYSVSWAEPDRVVIDDAAVTLTAFTNGDVLVKPSRGYAIPIDAEMVDKLIEERAALMRPERES